MSEQPEKPLSDLSDAEFNELCRKRAWSTPVEKPKLPDARGLTAEEFEKQMQRIKQGYYS
jgi:hypothetical protein